MNIDDLTIGQAKQLTAMVGQNTPSHFDNGMIGSYVIVRCRDAGVHAGVLTQTNGRECVLTESRRLWYWKAAKNSAFLSGVAAEGLHEDSKVGAPIDIHLTENCEIIRCSDAAETSIRGMKTYEPA